MPSLIGNAIERAAVSAGGVDRLLYKLLIVGLVVSVSFTHYGLILDSSSLHTSILYADLAIVLTMTFLVFFNRLIDRKAYPARTFRVFFPLILLIAWWGISGLVHYKNAGFFWVCLIQYIVGILTVWMFPWVLLKHKLIEFSIDVILISSIFVALGAFIQVAFDPIILFQNVTSVLGVNHAQLGLYMLVVLALAFHRSWRTPKKWPILIGSLAFLTILVSGSRAAQMGSLAILVVYFFRKLTLVNFLKLVLGILVIGSVMTYIIKSRANGVADQIQSSSPVKSSAQKVDEFKINNDVTIDRSAGRRILMWIASWGVITSSSDRFFYGIGFSNFRWEFGHLIKLPFYTNGSHDVYLHVWTETGLIGLSLFLWTFFALIGFSFRHYKADPSVILLGGLAVAMLISGFTQETLYPVEAMGNVNVLFNFACLLFVLHAQMKKYPEA